MPVKADPESTRHLEECDVAVGPRRGAADDRAELAIGHIAHDRFRIADRAAVGQKHDSSAEVRLKRRQFPAGAVPPSELPERTGDLRDVHPAILFRRSDEVRQNTGAGIGRVASDIEDDPGRPGQLSKDRHDLRHARPRQIHIPDPWLYFGNRLETLFTRRLLGFTTQADLARSSPALENKGDERFRRAVGDLSKRARLLPESGSILRLIATGGKRLVVPECGDGASM